MENNSRIVPGRAPGGKVVAFIDLGTNSIRLLLVRIKPNGSYQFLTKQKEVVRLGEREFIDKLLQPESMRRAAVVCKKFVELARAYGAGEIIAVATSATRDAANKTQFLEMLKSEANLDVCPISGIEEARLIYLGVANGIRFGNTKSGNTKALFIDIGGGSTEVSIGDSRKYYFLHSFNLGAIRQTNMFLAGEAGPVSKERYDLIKAYIRSEAEVLLKAFRTQKIGFAMGSSGTIENLARIARVNLHKKEYVSPDRLRYTDLRKIVRDMCAQSLEERRNFQGINAQRADIIIAGAAILETLMEELSLTEIRISKRGLRDGLLLDYLSHSEFSDMIAQIALRKRSVMQLGLICSFDDEHAHKVSRFSLELFDSAQALGIYDFRMGDRELLEHAATLHDIGRSLSYENHHVNGYHIIMERGLAGFHPEELEILANLVYFHRKETPKKKHLQFAGLKKSAVGTIRVLSSLLRIAESLESSHTGAVENARFYIADAGTVVLELQAQKDCQLELLAVEKQQKFFKKVFGYDLTCKVIMQPEGKTAAP